MPTGGGGGGGKKPTLGISDKAYASNRAGGGVLGGLASDDGFKDDEDFDGGPPGGVISPEDVCGRSLDVATSSPRAQAALALRRATTAE